MKTLSFICLLLSFACFAFNVGNTFIMLTSLYAMFISVLCVILTNNKL